MHCLLFAYLPLVQSSILNGAVWFVQRLKGVAHVFVPQPGLLFIRNAEQSAHLLFNSVCEGQGSYQASLNSGMLCRVSSLLVNSFTLKSANQATYTAMVKLLKGDP